MGSVPTFAAVKPRGPPGRGGPALASDWQDLGAGHCPLDGCRLAAGWLAGSCWLAGWPPSARRGGLSDLDVRLDARGGRLDARGSGEGRLTPALSCLACVGAASACLAYALRSLCLSLSCPCAAAYIAALPDRRQQWQGSAWYRPGIAPTKKIVSSACDADLNPYNRTCRHRLQCADSTEVRT